MSVANLKEAAKKISALEAENKGLKQENIELTEQLKKSTKKKTATSKSAD